ncbi:MAG TPA: hypothetical protein VKX17_16595 [Planctomycetota bacterium]|nr:hypothetical protein [Planctomycetota bacterium]
MAALALVLIMGAVIAGEDEFKDVREIRTVETYVPYDEFLKIAGKDANATVMTLEEYRGLVELATARNGPAKAGPLPPVETSLMEAAYTGRAGDFSARFDAQFKFAIAGKEWTRCDLGPIQNVSRVTLDGQPGWIVLENGRATLLAKGQGVHSGTLSFALPLQIEDDVQKISAWLLNSASGNVRMSVPGFVAPSSNAGPLDAAYDAAADATSFTIPLARQFRPEDGALAFSAQWKRKYDSRKSEALLQAEHHVSYLLNPASPFFYWQASVQIGRRKTGELAFVEPPNCHVIRLAGASVHSWVRDAGVLRVLLDDAILGEVSISASGVLDAPNGDFALGAPQLKDARKDTRTIALYEPPGANITMTQTAGLRELSLDEHPPIAKFQWPAWEGRLARQFFIEQPNATAGARVTLWPNVFDTRTAAILYVAERSHVGPDEAGINVHALVELHMSIAVQPERGRFFSFNLAVPPQWKLKFPIDERRTGRGVSIEATVAGKEDNWTIKLAESADAAHPLELGLRFVLADMSWAENVWPKHSLDFSLPSITGARRAASYLGISAHPSIEITFREMPAWHSDLAGTLARLNVAEAELRAGLASDAVGGGEVKLDLSHAAPRGEYESVLYAQTMEQELSVRAQLRVLALERARAVDELVIDLPADAKDPHINGSGIREVAAGAKAGQRIVRFDAPWREVRMLRLDYRAPLAAGNDVPLPDVQIEGDFDSRRWIVFQSSGVVELNVKPGPSLLTASLDDTPSFGIPFKNGRALFAFTVAPGGQFGTFRTRNLESSPVQSNLVRDLHLTTVIDETGVVRTHAEFTLAYAQSERQYIEATLPLGAKLLELCVDERNAQPVQGGSAGAVKIPLPPRSTAAVELVYEQDFGTLGGFGSIDAVSPGFIDFPVMATHWTVCHPSGYAFEITGGNTTPLKPHAPRFFVTEFFGRLFEGSAEWTAWRVEAPSATVGLSDTALQKTDTVAAPQAQSGAQQLKAIETLAQREPLKARAIGGLAIPEGAVLKTGKLGASAEMVLSYRSFSYSAFAARTVFILAALVGVVLMLRVSLRAALLYLIAGMLLGALIPLALNWESPLLMIPFCEGLTLFALFLGAAYVSHAIAWLIKRRRLARLALSCVIFAAVIFSAARSVQAGEAEAVLIPYPKESALPVSPNPKETKVYVPKSIYLDLMSRVKPEKKDPVVDAPRTKEAKPAIVPLSFGNADYELSADANAYFVKGSLEVTTYDPKGWAKLPLDFGPAQLVALKIDGQPAGVSNQDGKLFVQLQGAKKYTLEFELRGALQLEAGRARVTTQVVPGGATRLTAVLPANVEIDAKALPSGAWITKDVDGKMQRCELALGSSGAVSLSWHSPDIRGASEPRISAQSYMQFELGADGYWVGRMERINVERAPVDQFSFQVIGDWHISSVAASGLAEWTVSGEGDARRLRLWFQKPISTTMIQIAGWAPLGAADALAAGVTLENALRKEGFIGLKHGGGRRFTAASLEGLKRSSQEELAAAVTLPEGAQPDRILHYNDSLGNARVQAELDPERTTLETQFAGILRDGRMLISARTRYTVLGSGPLRYEVELPPTWEIRTVRATLLRDWEIVESGGKKRLAIHFGTRATTGTEILWSAEAALAIPAQGSLRLDLPQPRAIGDPKTTESVDWIVGADPALSISQAAETTMLPVPVERAARWVRLEDGQEWRLAFRSLKADTKLALDVARQDSAVYATVVTFVRAAEEHVQINARIRYTIERAGRDRFAIKLLAGAELIGLDAKNLRGRETTFGADGVALTVLLQSPVTGEQIVDLTYRIPRVTGKDVVAAPPSIEDARAVEHYAGLLAENSAVVLAERHLLHPINETTPIKNAEELPFLPAGISRRALTQIYSGEPGWTMTLTRTGLAVETGQSAEVIRSELYTLIASDGGVRTLALFLVRNHALQFLQIEMPQGANTKLLAVSVDGHSASVSHGKVNGRDVLLLPLQRMADTDLPAHVSIAYEGERIDLPALHTSYSPQAPRVLDAPVVETLWRIYAPQEYDVSRSGGNVKEVVAGVLHSSRVSGNVKELERLDKIKELQGQTPAKRKKALQSIAELQQELNDNETALSAQARAGGEELKRISRDELAGQLQSNDANLRLGSEWQMKLSEDKRKKELEEAKSNELDPEQVREFMDNFNFLNIRWRAGALSRPAVTQAAPEGGMTLDDLRFQQRYAGFGVRELPMLSPPRFPDLRDTPPPADLGEEAADFLAKETASGVSVVNENFAAQLGMTQLNFRGVEVHPELTLTFRSKSATMRGFSIVGLVLIGAGVYFFRKRLSKAVG